MAYRKMPTGIKIKKLLFGREIELWSYQLQSLYFLPWREKPPEMAGAFPGFFSCPPTPPLGCHDSAGVEVSVPKSAACSGLAEAEPSLPNAPVWQLPPGKDILE